MGRLLGIALLVVGVWVGLEVYDQGVDGAFGGALAFLDRNPATAEERAPLLDRVGSTTLDAHRHAEERRERMLGAPESER